jgi:hypothetical protein
MMVTMIMMVSLMEATEMDTVDIRIMEATETAERKVMAAARAMVEAAVRAIVEAAVRAMVEAAVSKEVAEKMVVRTAI